MTPQRLSWLIVVSILSRISAFVIQLVTNILLNDHDADAYKNRYHLQITNSQPDFNHDTIQSYLYSSIEGFTKWDAQYLLEISNDGYPSEQHLAFFPLFPLIISIITSLLFQGQRGTPSYFLDSSERIVTDSIPSNIDLQRYMNSALVGVAINNFIFFPAAAVALYSLTKLVKGGDEAYAKQVVLWFCFNPASIFFSACYTESLFAALTFWSMFIIEYKSSPYVTTTTTKERYLYKPLKQKNRLVDVCFPTFLTLPLSSATRSNGLITNGFLAHQLILKYFPLTRQDRLGWSAAYYITTLMELAHDLLITILTIVINASGYIIFQMYSYNKFCVQGISKRKGEIDIKPDWCDYKIPHAYSQVQARYWNVGLFKYYEIKQVPNFLLALPMTCLVLGGSQKICENLKKANLNKRHLPYHIQAIVLTIFCGLCINVQVTTRLVASSCPVIYWICADSAKASGFKKHLLMMYFASYFVVGTALHSNFYPWT